MVKAICIDLIRKGEAWIDPSIGICVFTDVIKLTTLRSTALSYFSKHIIRFGKQDTHSDWYVSH